MSSSDFTPLVETHHRRRVAFDPTINLGHVLTFVGFLITGFSAYSALDKRVTLIESQSATVVERTREQGIVVALDTPGGNVIGVPELGDTVRYAAGVKPLVVHVDNQMHSAGYWVGSGANAIYISGPVVTVGNIGVVLDREYDPQARTRTESITAGKYKRLTNASEPLSAEARAVVQADVDYVYTLFVDAVAANRGVTADQVLEHMADGRVFRGQKALDAGLVDGGSTLDDLLQAMAADPAQFATRRKAVFKAKAALPSPSAGAAPKDTTSTREKEPTMPGENQAPITRASFEQDHAPLFAQLRGEFTTVGATQERERIQAVLAVGDNLPGHEKLLSTLAFDGKTTAPEASMAVLKAEGDQRAAAIKAHADDAPPAATGSAAPSDTVTKTKAEQAQEAKAYAKEKGVDFVTALKELGFAS